MFYVDVAILGLIGFAFLAHAVALSFPSYAKHGPRLFFPRSE